MERVTLLATVAATFYEDAACNTPLQQVSQCFGFETRVRMRDNARKTLHRLTSLFCAAAVTLLQQVSQRRCEICYMKTSACNTALQRRFASYPSFQILPRIKF